MAIRLAGPVTTERTERGDFAVKVNGIETFYCDFEAEADSMSNFFSSFMIIHQLTSSAFAFIGRLRQIRENRPSLSRVVDAQSELTPSDGDLPAASDGDLPSETEPET